MLASRRWPTSLATGNRSHHDKRTGTVLVAALPARPEVTFVPHLYEAMRLLFE